MIDFDQLARCGVATVHEAYGRRGVVDIDLVQVVPGTSAAGPARTVMCGQGDNLMVHAALDVVRPGEILVIAMPRPEPVALVGELLAIQAAFRNVAAVLVDAAIRDSQELGKVGLPIWARWVRATGAEKREVGSLDTPILVGGVSISSGDVIVLDGDGAVVVEAASAVETLQAAMARRDNETLKRGRYWAGELGFDALGLRDIFEKGGNLG